MEVDRIWRIDGLDGHANPAWQNAARRRRKFAEEVAAAKEESEAGDEEFPARNADPDRRNFADSEESVSASNSDEADASFRVIA